MEWENAWTRGHNAKMIEAYRALTERNGRVHTLMSHTIEGPFTGRNLIIFTMERITDAVATTSEEYTRKSIQLGEISQRWIMKVAYEAEKPGLRSSQELRPGKKRIQVTLYV